MRLAANNEAWSPCANPHSLSQDHSDKMKHIREGEENESSPTRIRHSAQKPWIQMFLEGVKNDEGEYVHGNKQ